MKTISLINEKGGVGKTTLSVHLAAGLAAQGHTVVLIDSDPQAHAGYQLGVKESTGFHDLLVRNASWDAVLRPVDPARFLPEGDSGNGRLFVLPSNIETRVVPMLVGEATLLKERLDELKDTVDYVVIDTSPTPSLVHAMIHLATDAILYPTQVESLALEGLSKSITHMKALNKHRELAGLREVIMAGVQPMMVSPKTNAHAYGISLLEQEFPTKLLPSIPVLTVFRDAAYALKTVFAYAPEHSASNLMRGVVKRVLKEMA